MFHIALFEPEIPPNTGNIIRLCANAGASLYLIHPLGFSLDEKRLQRAGLDYREWATIIHYDHFEAFKSAFAEHRIFACTTKGKTIYADVHYRSSDVFLFGPETRGLPAEIRTQFPDSQQIRIPMVTEKRSINLANTVSIILYEAWRQMGFSN
ncbi:tRNA (uridine(34)/cytosine(34)/5-carboxymethylaminomethyluridine(34)-2'-O)-methyltransferase TrmL [Coxiella burnetii]|uniref:tRNA (cytidine(34)-2'-O)-methyltransferase n=1 Tax=Coxiella burnetii (strain Dugway 5J108-111) TaxID=434922 RepID=A9KF86_COXBN|nr:tRNA (cytidine(34)-2'-O)-methyltransferase [Coxiella burnetii]ABS78169.1 23S rRNA methyltransferase [Coxiella burnetii Dugway 5J108-111]OYK80799.1 tRNA (uridine(34)/cytosine(34)/5-carboxymethylaminomethyluridine(34)-2'-O)-methyltransferase TrmL [Coxiella burnetii]OYK82887.1 tRNA (uridine(34)/cytosine(34)/5-carboxymethylaminomethyluridine(34)-2'-O)-methyltransferase TrmL [Coxiella burnetii]